jgi:hypothetical protein
MASWRFQGAKHPPNQNNSGSFHASLGVIFIFQEQPPAEVKRAQPVPHLAVVQGRAPERTLRFAAVRLG